MGPAIGIMWFLTFAAVIIVAVCITVAPLIIWRNTNRMNRLMVLMLLSQGVGKDLIDRTWHKGGDEFRHIFEKTPIEEYEAKRAAGKKP